jgi:hypothetical protein
MIGTSQIKCISVSVSVRRWQCLLPCNKCTDFDWLFQRWEIGEGREVVRLHCPILPFLDSAWEKVIRWLTHEFRPIELLWNDIEWITCLKKPTPLSGEKVVKVSRRNQLEPLTIPKSGIEGRFEREMLHEIAPDLPSTGSPSRPSPLANVVSDRIVYR